MICLLKEELKKQRIEIISKVDACSSKIFSLDKFAVHVL